MSRKEAQEVLLLYRPGFNDPDDEPMQAALQIVKQDPELATWFEQHCEFQRKLAAVFKEIQVPEGLKEQIISERKAKFSAGKQRVLIALACACILFCAFVIASQLGLLPSRQSPNTFVNFEARMIGDVQRLYPKMDEETNSLPEIQRFLATKGQSDITLPDQLAKTSVTGCAVIPWHGRSVSMICFRSPKAKSPTKPDLFLFVLDRTDVKGAPANSTPAVKQVKGLFSATWTSGNKIYLLSGFGDEAFVRSYL